MISDREIKSMVSNGELIVSDFRPEQLTPNGYDLTVGDLKIQGGKGNIDVVPPKTLFWISTMEKLWIRSGITGQIWLKSSFCRKGILGSFGLVDSGFRGVLTLTLYNASDEAVVITVGKPIAQIVFTRMSTLPEMTYEMRSGNFQDQVGIVTDIPERSDRK
ncbi:MAG: dCTP deaminase [Thermoplasmataceae archaeon]